MTSFSIPSLSRCPLLQVLEYLIGFICFTALGILAATDSQGPNPHTIIARVKAHEARAILSCFIIGHQAGQRD